MTTPMPPAMLAALNADLAVAARWSLIGAHVSIEEHTEGDPPVVVRRRRTTATLQSPARALTLIALLAGPEFGAPTEVAIVFMGSPYVTADAQLIARIDAAVTPLLDLRAGELVARLTAPLPEAAP